MAISEAKFQPDPPPGPMLDALAAALGGHEALQRAITELILASPPRLRMDAVRELWRRHCNVAS